MILKSTAGRSNVTRFTDSRDDENFIFEDYLTYFPPLPKIYSSKIHRFQGFQVNPSTLSCSCTDNQKGYVSYEDICDHLIKVLLTHYKSELSAYQFEFLKILQQGHSFNSGLKYMGKNLLAFISKRDSRSELMMQLHSESKYYIFFPATKSWKFNQQP